jgi:hypothetical protein
MDLKKAIGIEAGKRETPLRDPFLLEYVNVKLASLGQPIYGKPSDYQFMPLAGALLGDYQEKSRLLAGHLCPVDMRIQAFIDGYLSDLDGAEPRPRLPENTLVLDRHGLARMLSIPPDADEFKSSIVDSFRVAQGVLHNPKSDRRTTKGVFHVTEGGLPITADKVAVPKVTFARMLKAALNPPRDLMRLPLTCCQEEQAEVWCSLMLRPIVSPDIPGTISKKRYECRFFAPGNLVSNLDFVESIFGNAGDPVLPENDSGLDAKGWTGHTGCVILAPHLIGLTKKELGLPNISVATDRQKAEGMCWEKEDEIYNNGSAFKLTCRNSTGVVVTIIADNYFGYCKKEVKTQISYSANLYGLAEEEHAGGALAFPSYDLGEDFRLATVLHDLDHTYGDVVQRFGDLMDAQPEGYAIDKNYPDVYYVPEDAFFSLAEQTITWTKDGTEHSIRLSPGITYVLPSGYRVEMVKPAEGRRWRLIGTTAEGTYCHKPCTVSGGGKSEISKSISDAIIYGPVIVTDFQSDFDKVEEIIDKEYGMRFKDPERNREHGRPILGNERSLGSVIKLLTPSVDYTDEYNEWLKSIPYYIKELVFIVKRHYKPDWGKSWRDRFHVDLVNGVGGNQLRYRENLLVTQYLRVGFTEDGAWRTYGLRKDFYPSFKLQTEDDISASIVMPRDRIPGLPAGMPNESMKFIDNCEFRLFQRPDEAIHRGYDKRTELDMSLPGNFFSNYQPLDHDDVTAVRQDSIRFDQYTQPVKDLINSFLGEDKPDYLVIPSHPRIVDGKPTKNPRYLQDRDDLVNPRRFYLGEVGTRLYRYIPTGEGVPRPVNAVLPGRRNNPPEPGIRALAVFNPVHYLPLPEFFMEIISSMTGKSPSTTGAGSEGALTKGPFNCLPQIIDLNNALVSFVLTGYQPFVTAAGYVGPKCRVDHDISLLVPEIWCRLKPEERCPKFMIEHGYLEKCPDVEFEGKTIPSSILGYRLTDRFVRTFFGRVFANPGSVFTEEMLKPELQGLDLFADGMDNIIVTHERVAKSYFEDGTVEGACPPLKALLKIMAEGDFVALADEEFRKMFTREALIASDWYQARLQARQDVEVKLWKSHIEYLEGFQHKSNYLRESERLGITDKLAEARHTLEVYSSPDRLKQLVGTLGTDPYAYQPVK